MKSVCRSKIPFFLNINPPRNNKQTSLSEKSLLLTMVLALVKPMSIGTPILLAIYAVNTVISSLRRLQQEALQLIKIQLCNSNCRFQSLAKVKIDLVKKTKIFFNY